MFAILIFVCLWMIFKDSNKQCPECKGRLKLYERVVRSVGEGRCGVADKYLCRRCGKHWVVRHISTLGNYYVGVWHGGKEGWGAKAYSSVETQPFLGNVNNDGQLMIFCNDDRLWYEKIGFFYKEIEKIQIYLPKNSYQGLYAYSTNGDINVPKGFTFDGAHLSVVNGKINMDANAKQSFSAETTNGDIALNGELNGQIHALTTNGKITAKNIKNADWADFTTTNGNIELDGNVIKQFEAQSVNGSIKFGVVISDRIHMNTVNGSITGTVPANKSCMGKSTNGTVNIPNRAKDSGDFYFKTVNGNIDIKEK